MLLCCPSAIAGTSHKMFKYPPAQVFAAAVRVAQRGVGATVDAKTLTLSFSTGSSGAYLGVNKLDVFFTGLPDGCGETNPCTATKIEVKCTRVYPDTMGFRLCSGDVQNFFTRLEKELKSTPASSIAEPAPGKPSM